MDAPLCELCEETDSYIECLLCASAMCEGCMSDWDWYGPACYFCYEADLAWLHDNDPDE